MYCFLHSGRVQKADIFKPESNFDPGKGGGVIRDEDREEMKRSVVLIDTHEYVDRIV